MPRIAVLFALCAQLCACSLVVKSTLDDKPTEAQASDAGAADSATSMLRDASAGSDAEALRCDDNDGDGYGVGNGLGACQLAEDCDDTNDAIFPGAPEECDDIDSDCDSMPDADEIVYTWPDQDEDGFGFGPTNARTQMTCAAAETAGRVDNNLDCLDVGDNAYCINPLFPQSPTEEGGCSNNPADFPSSPYTLPSSELSWDYNCDGVVSKQHAENVTCVNTSSTSCTVSETSECNGAEGIAGEAACGELVTVHSCFAASTCHTSGDGLGDCRESQFTARMGCR